MLRYVTHLEMHNRRRMYWEGNKQLWLLLMVVTISSMMVFTKWFDLSPLQTKTNA